MTNRFVFTLGEDDWPGPGEWRPLWTSEGVEVGFVLSASLGCPDCGAMARLTDHKIFESGKVAPSVVCPTEVCNFHETVRLENWNSEQERLRRRRDDQ